MVVLILGTLMHHFSSFKLVKNPKKKSQSTTKDPISVSDTVQKSKKYHSYDYEKKKTSSNKRNSADDRKTMRASEIREESKNSLINCADVTAKEDYADCVIDNLSLEFFFTAFVFYKKRFKKNYGSVREENRRFQIFMKKYQKILK